MKERLHKVDFIKIKNVCLVKDNIKRMRRLGENTCKRHI